MVKIFLSQPCFKEFDLKQSPSARIQVSSSSASTTEVDEVQTLNGSLYLFIAIWSFSCYVVTFFLFSFLLLLQIDYGEEGSKERYYAVKFDAATEEDRERIRRDVVMKPSFNLLLTVCLIKYMLCCDSIFLGPAQWLGYS